MIYANSGPIGGILTGTTCTEFILSAVGSGLIDGTGGNDIVFGDAPTAMALIEVADLRNSTATARSPT